MDPRLGFPGRYVEDQRVRVDLAEPGAAARDEERHGRSLSRMADISAACPFGGCASILLGMILAGTGACVSE